MWRTSSHTHNPTQKGGVVDRHPNKRESIPPGTSCLLVKQEPHITDHKLGRGLKLKVQDRNFMKKHEEISQKKSVKFQEETNILLSTTPPHLQGNKMHSAHSPVSTKHKVLAITASIFGPLGLLSPAVVAYKIFLQHLWQDKLHWNEPLFSHLQQEWN